MLGSLSWLIWSEGLQALWVRVLSLPSQHLRGHGPMLDPCQEFLTLQHPSVP